MVKYKLDIFERLTLLGIVPHEGSFVTLRLVRDLTEKVGLSAEEITKFGVKETVNAEGKAIATWNMKMDTTVEIDLKEKEADIATAALKKLNDQNKLEQRHFTLYQKFVEGDHA